MESSGVPPDYMGEGKVLKFYINILLASKLFFFLIIFGGAKGSLIVGFFFYCTFPVPWNYIFLPGGKKYKTIALVLVFRDNKLAENVSIVCRQKVY